MASKGQKFNMHTDKLKEEIIKRYFNNEGSSRSLAKEYKISYKSIDTMIYRHKHPELKTGNKKGRKKEADIDYKERYEILKKYQAFLKAQRERK